MQKILRPTSLPHVTERHQRFVLVMSIATMIGYALMAVVVFSAWGPLVISAQHSEAIVAMLEASGILILHILIGGALATLFAHEVVRWPDSYKTETISLRKIVFWPLAMPRVLLRMWATRCS